MCAAKTPPGQRRRKPKASSRPLAVKWEAGQFPVPIPRNETRRQAELESFHILDSEPEPNFDHVTLLASHICGTPIALISLIDSDRQWFKSRVGLSFSETSRNVAFCAHAIMQRELMVVPDATQDKRFAGNPLVRSAPKIRFYAGAPLVTPDKHALGTLCVMDRVPRKLTREQLEALRALSGLVMVELEARRRLIQFKRAALEGRRREKDLQNKLDALHANGRSQSDFLLKLSHEIGTVTSTVRGLIDQALSDYVTKSQRESLEMARSAVDSLVNLAEEARTLGGSPPGLRSGGTMQ